MTLEFPKWLLSIVVGDVVVVFVVAVVADTGDWRCLLYTPYRGSLLQPPVVVVVIVSAVNDIGAAGLTVEFLLSLQLYRYVVSMYLEGLLAA